MGSCKVLKNTQGETWQHSATQRNPDKSVTDRAVPHGNKHPPSSATADTEMPPCCPLGSSAPPQHLRHDSKCFFFPVSPGTCDQPGRSHLSEFIQFLLQVKNLKYAQPHSSEGHQDQQEHHEEADAPPFPVVPWLSAPVGYRWWERSHGGCRGAGSTCISTAVHPKDLGVHVVQVLLHGRERDGLDMPGALFPVAPETCRAGPSLSPGGSPSFALVRLHPCSGGYPARLLRL